MTIMGISIGTAEAGQISVTLECDVAEEFFCRGVEHFSHPDGFIGIHADAMSRGWLERSGSQGRIWLCPACSGKRA